MLTSPVPARWLRFALSEHLAPSYHWFSTSHVSDKTGPLAGVPYDGADASYADLYHELPKYYPYSYRILNDRQAPTLAAKNQKRRTAGLQR
jgi:alpha-L-fucosidase